MSSSAMGNKPFEYIFDEDHKPRFKRADLGRYLGLLDIKGTFRDVPTRARNSLQSRGASDAPLKRGQNNHDVFVTLDGAIDIAVRSNKAKAVALVKWLVKKGVDKIQEEHQIAIEIKESTISLLNDDLDRSQLALKQKTSYIASITHNLDMANTLLETRGREIQNLIRNRHVPLTGRCYDEVFAIVKKNCDHNERFSVISNLSSKARC